MATMTSTDRREAMKILMMICPSHRWALLYAILLPVGFALGYVWAS
jgi:hypothetical protein